MKRIIIVLLVLSCIRFSYAEELNSNLDELAKEQVESRFLKGEKPIRYYTNILILLQGFPTKEDSAIFNELVDTLNVLIDKWDVALIPNGTSNLSVDINLPHTGDWKNFFHQNSNASQIIKSTVCLDLTASMDFISRKKIIYYNILRSLVVFNADQKKAISIPGSVFNELKAENITFHPVDFEIIKILYSMKYEDKPTKLQHVNRNLNSSYKTLLELVAILIALIYLIYISQSGILIKHNYEFGEYLKQGILVFMALLIFVAINTFSIYIVYPSNFRVLTGIGAIIIGLFTVGVFALISMYFIERLILFKRDNLMLEVIVPLLTTLFVPVLLLLGFKYFISTIQNSSISLLVFMPVISFAMLIAIARAFYIYMNKKSENIIRRKDLELARLSELHKQAELQSLRAKINPHFLYNALNSIASLATTDARKTEQMALALSDFFKYAINREQKQLNTLSEELNAIRTYLEIEKVRFGDRLSFEIDCPAELLEIQIPQLLIQPLVENAIKHGLSQITENGLIGILVSKEENQLKIRVYDNGPAFPKGPLSGFGIQNTQERIALLYGAKATINWQNGAEKYIEINIPIGN